MIRNLPSHIVRLIVYILLQVLIFKQIAFFDVAFSFVYVLGLLLLPIELGHLTMIGVGFLTGLTVDLFYNTQGIQAAACVLIMFVRPYYFRQTTRGRYDPGMELNIREMGFNWFVVFNLPLIFIHHLVVFYAESGSTNLFFYTFSKAFFSSIFTFMVALIFQYLLTKPRRRI